MKKPIIILAGPTAVGKSALSIELAKRIHGAVISADSMQVYKHMDIGSAKITIDEMQGIQHYMIDELEPDEEFHVVRFQSMAKQYLHDIYEKGQIPILTGGTGFYIQALLYDIDFSKQEADEEYRRELENLADKNGAEYLHHMLKQCDPKAAGQIHPNNVKRVIRALEFHKQSKGQRISEHNEAERAKESPYNFAYFVLNDQRERLYANIDLRVDQMMEQGLLEEVKKLVEMGYTRDMVAMQGLGYKELISYFSGEYSLERALYLIKRDTRHFAKRQLTWFKRERDVIWLDKSSYGYDNEKMLADMLNILHEKNIV